MKIFKIIIISNILIFLLGCNKKDDNIYFKGNIVGFVCLVDETGYRIKDKSGVNVSIEGLSNSINTDKDGRFEFTNIPAGTYNLICNKTGYGTRKIFSYQFIGGNIPALLNEITLYELPNIELQGHDISFNDSIINISGKLSETSHFKVLTFINDSSNVSYLNYDHTTSASSNSGWVYSEFYQSIYLSDTPYKQGDKVYLVFYFINPDEEIMRYDYEKEKYIYTSYKKASNVIDLILE